MDLTSTKLSETKQEREKRLAERFKEDVKELMKVPGNRRVIWAWLMRSGVFGECFVQGMPDQTAYNLGKVAQGREILNDVTTIEPAKYTQMQQEYASEQASFEALDKRLENA